ncbi:MAG: hypothetical protein ACTSYO_02065 [Candidatus Ranarchaeia archaeon]
MVEVASCIRHAFMFSNGLRKNVRLYLVFETDNGVKAILFDGKLLRYVEPSERNTLLLLGRALKICRGTSRIIESTPGIFCLPWDFEQIKRKENWTRQVLAFTNVSNLNYSAIIHSIRSTTLEDKVCILTALEPDGAKVFPSSFARSSHIIDYKANRKNMASTIILICNVELDRANIP